MDEVEPLQRTVINYNAGQGSVDEALAQLKRSVAASDALAAKLTESKKGLETLHTEVSALEEQIVREGTEKTDSNKAVAEVQKETEQLLVRLKAVLAGRNQAEKLRRTSLRRLARIVDAVFHQLPYEALIRLRQGLERPYSTVCAPFPVALT